MSLTNIAVFIILSLLSRIHQWRFFSEWMIIIASLLFVYWLQPLSTIRSLEFWLPTLLILLAIVVWMIASVESERFSNQNKLTFVICVVLILCISSMRYLNINFLSARINPPHMALVLVLMIGWAGLLWLLQRIKGRNIFLGMLLIAVFLGIFIILKLPSLTGQLSILLRKWNQQSTALANAREIMWVGYSYFSFRLIHVIREWQQGRPIQTALAGFISFVLFFPTFIAGPIDRADHFQKELLNRHSQPMQNDFIIGGQRIAAGLFYKFVLADSLALIAFTPDIVAQVNSKLWLWVIIYAYALRLFFDFAGYTHLAIGIAKLMGIRLPENFDKPYRASNLTLFWNRWHMTLTQWFRTYYFNPVTRYLRTHASHIPAVLIIFFTQVSTMLLIGLWHGISWNFVIWGFWNGLGLFIHNRWAEWRKSRAGSLDESPLVRSGLRLFSIFFTFNFITLGWVWFALPAPADALLTFSKLFGGV